MSSPRLTVQLAFGYPPLTANADALAFDATDFIRGTTHIKRGRQDERGEFEAGTAIVTLDNKDRRFDPNNTASPYYPNIKPMVKVRIGATWEGFTYWLFTGYVESWQPSYGNGTLAWTTLRCVDAFKYFNLTRIVTGLRSQERSGTRLNAALIALGWPPDEGSITAGSIAVGDIDVPAMPLNQSALSLMQAIAQAERSAFYVNGAGTVRFEGRSYRSTLGVTDTWGDEPYGSELPYSSVDIRFDDSRIWNRISVSRYQSPTEPQVAGDVASQTTFFPREYALENQLFVSDTDALAAADLMLARYKDARPRPARLVIDPGVRNTWTNVLRREISDVIRINQRNLHDSGVTTLDAHIESVEWTVEKERWQCAWQLSPFFTALTGTSTLVTRTIWQEPIMSNGWVNAGGANVTAGYWKDKDGWVHLRGLVRDGTATAIFRLPIEYRPVAETRFTVYTNSPDYGSADITIIPTGLVQSGLWGPGLTVDLSAISFRVH